MSEYITLMGAESVQSAGRNISDAADKITLAANQFDESVSRLTRFLEDILQRAEAVVAQERKL